MRVRTSDVESRISEESEKEKERKQEDPVLLMLTFLLASGIGGLARAFSPVRVIERWLTTFSLTPVFDRAV